MKNILPLHGGNLVYKSVGKDDADTIFFCHSLGANQSLWDRQIEQLSHTYRSVTCDLRGHGESPLPDPGFGRDDLVDDLARLRDRHGLARKHLSLILI